MKDIGDTLKKYISDRNANNEGRPTWDEYFLDIAEVVANRATCPVASVGAVFVDYSSKIILSTGYNGSPRGMPHCGEGCANRKMGENSQVCKAIHAEINAIYNSNGRDLRDSILYCTMSPCPKCAEGIIQVGTREVVWSNTSPYQEGIDYLREAGIQTWEI